MFNPMPSTRQTILHIPINAKHAKIYDANKRQIEADVVPSDPVQLVKGSSTHSLVIPIALKPFELSFYHVDLKPSGVEPVSPEFPVETPDVTMSNKYVKLVFCGKHGILKSMTSTLSGRQTTVELHQSLGYYLSYQGEGARSGAYLFRPTESAVHPIATTVVMKLIRGKVVQEVHQTFSSWAKQVFRLYKDSQYVEVEWTVGPIPLDDGKGKEVISRFSSNIKSNRTWYTDSNGREFVKRTRNHRDSWNVTLKQPVAGNYYPVTSGMYLGISQQWSSFFSSIFQ